jgi:hypothetical protein
METQLRASGPFEAHYATNLEAARGKSMILSSRR